MSRLNPSAECQSTGMKMRPCSLSLPDIMGSGGPSAKGATRQELSASRRTAACLFYVLVEFQATWASFSRTALVSSYSQADSRCVTQ